jgi:hypothetical protein
MMGVLEIAVLILIALLFFAFAWLFVYHYMFTDYEVSKHTTLPPCVLYVVQLVDHRVYALSCCCASSPSRTYHSTHHTKHNR